MVELARPLDENCHLPPKHLITRSFLSLRDMSLFGKKEILTFLFSVSPSCDTTHFWKVFASTAWKQISPSSFSLLDAS